MYTIVQDADYKKYQESLYLNNHKCLNNNERLDGSHYSIQSNNVKEEDLSQGQLVFKEYNTSEKMPEVVKVKLIHTSNIYVPSIDSPPPGRGAGIVEYKPF